MSKCLRSKHFPFSGATLSPILAILWLGLLWATTPLPAQTTYYWRSAPGTASWNTATNWADTQGGTSGGVVPNGTTINAVFDTSTQTSLTFTAGSFTVSSIVFNAGSPAYTFTFGSGRVLSLSGAGVVNNSVTTKPIFTLNSGSTLNFNGASSAANATLNANSALLNFNGTASAGNATVNINTDSTASFNDTSSAGNATVNVNSGGLLYFNGTSSAGNATFSYTTPIQSGEIWFQGNSTAGNATIAVGKQSIFTDNAKAGNATFTIAANSSIDFGGNTSAENATFTLSGAQSILYFNGASTGGTAVVNAGASSSVVFSGLTSSGITLGSIAGAGNFYLGDKTLTVGSKNLSTEVSGSLLGAFSFPFTTGGSLIKVGTGTLTLSGANTYSGSTVVQGGTLLVAHSDALAGSTLNYNNGDGLVSFGTLTRVNLGGLTGNHNLTLANPNGDATTLTVGANGDSTTYSGVLSGAGVLVKAGTGTLTLSGLNTQAGGVQVTNGVFKLAEGATFGAGPLNVTGGAFDLNGATFSLGNLVVNGGTVSNGILPISTFSARSGTISAAITGGEFIKSGPGSLHLTGTNSYTGPTTITGGGLRVAPGSLPVGSYYRFDGGALGVGEGDPTSFMAGTGEGQVSWVGDGGFAAYGGTRTITFNGSGTQTWGQNGFVPVGNALILGANGSDSLTIFANAVDFGGGTRTVRVEKGSAALDATLSGALTNGSLVKAGDGTLSLTGANSYAGGTRITGGLIEFTALSAMGPGTILLDGGGLRWSVGTTTDVSASVSYGNGGSIFDTNGNNVVLASAVGIATGGGTTSGGLTKLGTGTLTLQGNNQYTGTTTVSQGTLVVTGNNSATGDLLAAAGATVSASGNAHALGSGTVTINTGRSLQLAYDANTNFDAGLHVNGDAPILVFNRATTGAGVAYTFKDAFFAGTTGGQIVTLERGALATTGTTTVGFDNVSTGSDVTLTATTGMLVNMSSLAIGTGHGLTLTETGASSATTFTIGALSGTNSGLYTLSNKAVSVTITGPITGQDLMIQLYTSGTKTFSVASTFTGTTDLWKGTVVVGDNAAFGQSRVALDTLTFRSTGGPLTIGNALDLWSGVTFSGNTNLTFTGLLTNANDTNVNTVTISNTAITTFGSVNLSNSATNRTITFSTGTGANAVINGTIANGGTSTASNLTKSGTGNLTLTGSNSYSGSTTLTGGTLIIGHNSALGTSTLSFNGGTLAGDGTARTLANALSLAANSTIGGASNLTFDGSLNLGTTTRMLTVTNTGSTIFAGILSGTAGLTKAGAGELTLSGLANIYTGKTSIAAGTLAVAKLNVLGSSSSLGAPTTLANGTIDIGNATTGATLKYTGATATTNRVMNLSGTTGGATLEASGTGSITFSSAFTATGAGNKTLTLDGTNTGLNTIGAAIVNNTVSNRTSLVKTGVGTWVLGGTNTYTGSTSVNSGTLLVNGSLANTAVAVSSGATFGGSGTVAGLTTVFSGGHLAPGNSPGTLTFTNGLTLNAGSILDFQIGTTSDSIRVSGGTLTGPLTGTILLNLSDAGGFNPLTGSSYTLFNFAGATTATFTASQFGLGSLLDGTSLSNYTFNLDGTASTLSLVYTPSAIPEPATYAAIFGATALAVAVRRRKRLRKA
jgi:fibronectin-binding autotransporter adhesin